MSCDPIWKDETKTAEADIGLADLYIPEPVEKGVLASESMTCT